MRVRGNIVAENVPLNAVCMLTLASGQTQTLLTGTSTTLSNLNTVRINTGGFTASNGTITIPEGSGYNFAQLFGQIAWDAVGSPAGYRQIVFSKNGETVMLDNAGDPYITLANRQPAVTGASQASFSQAISPLIPCTDGDVFAIIGAHTQGSNLDIVGGGAAPAQQGTFSAFFLRAFSL